MRLGRLTLASASLALVPPLALAANFIAANPAPQSVAATEECGGASYYGDSLAGNSTASGAPYDPLALTAAHRTLPFGSMVRVTDAASGETVEVEINDRGPFIEGRIIDLSGAAAKAIGLIERGVGEVCITVIEPKL